MRITTQMLTNNFLSDMQTNLTNMSTIQQQMSSGKQINKPSDDPFKTTRILQLQSSLDANSQYKTNIKDANDFLSTTDTTLGQVSSVLQKINELLVSSGNASYGPDELSSIKDEVNQNIQQLAQVLNTNFDGKYIFGGTRATTKPVDTIDNSGNSELVYYDKSGGALPAGSTDMNLIGSKLNVEISQGVVVPYSTSAVDVMQFTNSSGNSKDLRTILNNIVSDLGNGNTTNLTTTDLQDIKDAISNVADVRSQVGAMEDRMSTAKDKNQAETTNLTEILSNNQDIDITEKTMEYATAQTVYTAALQTSAKVIQKSLLDYLQ